ncbi:hypothetical protein PC129_g10875 [Phytophthora cactorum]|uniref:Uncharacterized protein n=1 Tax=Phytophthora cactorum TaxID=29920 RepID=A0A8T1I236_9STRA|nr:hypothetical protein Pcac1_g18426 [Phytophthora cactorum]KAG3218317.1 hypothetical protein PC129_g10875 [Phytophthora cactorum]
MMQSSGFGKSRILYEVAKKLAGPTTGLPGSELFDSRFLSTTYALEYACSNWESTKSVWLELFGVDSISDSSIQESAVGDTNRRWVFGISFEEGGEWKPQSPPVISQKIVDVKGEHGGQDGRVKVLFLAIDEAESLLSRKDGNDYLHLFRRALRKVNRELRGEKLKVMVFAVIVDTTAPIQLPLCAESSSRNILDRETSLFPPFVLTHTMDVVLNHGQLQQNLPFYYKASVHEVDPDRVWNTLVSMGRPIWHSYATTDTKDPKDVLILAATKLFGGLGPFKKESYGSSSLQGVAALLCRLGLRLQARSVFASQAVADFMAILHYVNYTYDAHISGYGRNPCWHSEQRTCGTRVIHYS